ncbi:MAG: hypothetical protein IMF14_00785 [Proteobacteria bacterium]|nr:hypothetical protein [Pseudomonadota bacterium]
MNSEVLNMTLIRFFAVSVLSVIFASSCSAEDKAGSESLESVFQQYLSPHTIVLNKGKPASVRGDFNGDGFSDVAVVFLPATEIAASDLLHVSRLRRSPEFFSSGKPHRSLAIFHGGKAGWSSGVIQVFVLLDDSGALETPSFELLISRVDGNAYSDLVSGIPVEPAGDLIILPTEAGIDTYLYWNRDRYKLFEPEDIP